MSPDERGWVCTVRRHQSPIHLTLNDRWGLESLLKWLWLKEYCLTFHQSQFERSEIVLIVASECVKRLCAQISKVILSLQQVFILALCGSTHYFAGNRIVVSIVCDWLILPDTLMALAQSAKRHSGKWLQWVERFALCLCTEFYPECLDTVSVYYF